VPRMSLDGHRRVSRSMRDQSNPPAEHSLPPRTLESPASAAITPAPDGRFRENVYLAIIVGAISFAGGAAGTTVAAQFESARWQRETTVSLRREVLSKRMELLERTIKTFNMLQILDMYKASGGYSIAAGVDQLQAGRTPDPSLDAAIESVVKVKEAQAELSAVMTLDAIYFGPKSKLAVHEFQESLDRSQTWWQLDKARSQRVLDALAEELQFGM
jgi:hypothetical protein